jgi:hypothetical protein
VTAAAGRFTPDFLAFWARYPRKDGKIDGQKAFDVAVRLAPGGARQIIEAVQRYAFRPDPQYQPLPGTWLRRGSWIIEDDTPPSTVASAPRGPNGRRHEAAELAEDLGLDLITPIAEQFHDSQPEHPANHALADQTGSADVRRPDAGDKAADRPLCGDLFD